MTQQHPILMGDSTAGVLLGRALTDVIEATYTNLRATANPNHLVAAG